MTLKIFKSKGLWKKGKKGVYQTSSGGYEVLSKDGQFCGKGKTPEEAKESLKRMISFNRGSFKMKNPGDENKC